MLVNVIYDHGKIIWPDNVKLQNDKIPIVVDVPDDVIKKVEEDSNEYDIKNPQLKEKMAKLDAIRHYKGPFIDSGLSDKELLLEGIKMKYGFQEEK